jgi:hypothetical protein
MNKKIGLLYLYALLITSALRASSKASMGNLMATMDIVLSILGILMVFMLWQRRQDR